MAKAFGDGEKALIKEYLKKAAIECMQKYGIRKTSVDELTRLSGISKGAFYLFYESKEQLFFEAIMEYHEKLHTGINNMLSGVKGYLTPDRLTLVIFRIIKENQPFWTSLLINGDIEYLMRKLSDQSAEIHLLDDKQFFEELMRYIEISPNMDVEDIAGAFRAIFMTIMNVKTIGETVYDNALKILIKGVVQQLYDYPPEPDTSEKA